ncbi:MAG: beta-galactosidase [Lachnospiraceae bacterium]|nr:beta-galactosidase [Lachnospiraceae bacterium]
MKQATKIYYGGDYNPDQWDKETIHEDMKLFKKAHVNLLTLPVFSWAKLEPKEGVYDFGWLDEIIDEIWANGIRVCLATPTTAQPAWLSTKYPEVLPVDIQGRKRTHGMRVFFCVNSAKYRERAAAIAGEMAKRYAHHPALAMWHVSNEYGTYCYCPTCQKKFREWLMARYGTLEELNTRWHTSFWGRTLTDVEEVTLPTELNDDYRFNPTIQLDYMRFVTDSTASCFQNEYDVLKSYNPEIPILTNMSGFIKKLDQFTMAKHLDMIGWDNYPWPDDPPYFVAMKHDIMRGLKGGQSFVLTEQSPNQQNWQPYNRLKRPGEVRMLSYQAMAHGADTCLFFQMRQSIGGQEKFHGALISHAGRDDTRVFRECTALGEELERIGDAFLTARSRAKAAILFDWNNWWALELASGPSKDLDYLKTVSTYYETLFRQNIAVDFVPFDADLSSYQLVVAPMLYMCRGDIAERITDYVRGGGIFVTTELCGIADENDRCVYGEYPGKFKDVLGLRVEETDALRPYEHNTLVLTAEGKKHFAGASAAGASTAGERDHAAPPLPDQAPCGFLCDLIHADLGAKVLAGYGEDFYAGMPAICVNSYGNGEAYYIGTAPEQEFLDALMENICASAGLCAPYRFEEGIEMTIRDGKEGPVLFIMNHAGDKRWVDLGKDRYRLLTTGEELTGRIMINANDVYVAGKIRG